MKFPGPTRHSRHSRYPGVSGLPRERIVIWADQAAAVIAAALVADEEHSGGPESVGIVRPHALVRP